jgi:hypothetical protein
MTTIALSRQTLEKERKRYWKMKIMGQRSGRILLLTVLQFSGAVLQASAYYHPEEGRWLSRDPIGEEGGHNIYSYISNQPVSQFDTLGLRGCCGPDVTDALFATIRDVETKFASWTPSKKASKCSGLKLAHVVLVGWDIWPLFELGSSGRYEFTGGAKGTPPCERTVAFMGQCVQANAANYVLFGAAFRLCDNEFGHYPLNEALNFYVEPYKDLWILRTAILDWRKTKAALRARGQARFFTSSGFNTWFRLDDWRGLDVEADCTVTKVNKVQDAKFDWDWRGMFYEF